MGAGVLELWGLCLEMGMMGSTLACFFWKGLAINNFLTLNSVAGLVKLVPVWRVLVGVSEDDDGTSVGDKYSVFE